MYLSSSQLVALVTVEKDLMTPVTFLFCIFLKIINAALFYFLTDVLRLVFSARPLVNKAKQESLPTSRSRSHNRSQVSCTGTLTYICCRDRSHIFPWTEEKERLISLSSIGFCSRPQSLCLKLLWLQFFLWCCTDLSVSVCFQVQI